MQILGKKSKVLLIAVAIVMLVAVGVSFAVWDNMSTVKAANEDLSTYANAKIGDVITFGNYYQTGNKVSEAEDAEYEKTPIEWLVVDKDERTGQLTLMSKYILAAGSYFGNWYNSTTTNGHLYNLSLSEVNKIPYNQAYVESTARAFLNSLERRDLGGDAYTESEGYRTSISFSTDKLLTSVGFSNRTYSFNNSFKRPIKNVEYKNRPATRGFYDEAFNENEKSMILPRVIAGYTGHRWPNNLHDPTNMSHVEGAVDKVWLPSATELNALANNDDFTSPSDEASSTVFKYFKDKSGAALQEALKACRTPFVENNSKAMNYSIPVYKYQSTEINEDIHEKSNSTDTYWTRSPLSHYFSTVRVVNDYGVLSNYLTYYSNFGVRPCIILKY